MRLIKLLFLLTFLTIQAKSQSQPNIIYVMMDDISAIEFSAYSDSLGANTPTIDLMADQGVAFKTAYSQPLCGPSRAMVLTAKYSAQNGHFSHANRPGPTTHDDHYTIGTAMRDAGYRTGFYGKQQIDRATKNPSDFGFDRYVVCKRWPGHDGPSQGRTGPDGLYGATWYWHPGLIADGVGVPTTPNDFGPNIELDSILSFIGEASSQPFYVHWPTNLPHSEYDPVAQSWYRPDVPEFDASGNLTGNIITGSVKSNIEYVDQALKKIVQKLEDTGQLNNTIIFLTADNGSAGKGKGETDSERGVHVPLFVYGPGNVVHRNISDVLVDLTDMIPTFLDLANYSTPETASMDGKSFAPYLLSQPFQSRDWIAAQLDESRWLRTREWLLDGDGALWYCGQDYDYNNFVQITDFSIQANQDQLDAMEDTLDQHFPGVFLNMAASYRLVNRHAQYDIRNAACNTAPNTFIELTSGTGVCAQWSFIEQSGNWLIQNEHSGLNLRNDDCNTTFGTKVEQVNGTGVCSQWELEFIETVSGTEYYALKNMHSGMYMRPVNCNTTQGTQMELSTATGVCAQWQLVPIGSTSGARLASEEDLSEVLSVGEDNISVYPNPVADHINIQGINGRIEIFNTLGHKVYQLENIDSTQRIDISAFRSGIYFLKTQGSTYKILKR